MADVNKTLMESSNGLVVLRDKQDPWGIAIDVVDYPVIICDGYFMDEDGTYIKADGESNQGRDKGFRFVVTDPHRNGCKKAIAPVTGQYSTIKTATVYEDLKEELELSEIPHTLEWVWVSTNGGQQCLKVGLDDIRDMEGLPDKIKMSIYVRTSVDGSTAHNLSMVVTNVSTGTDISIFDANIRLSARHTQTIKKRVVHYIPMINKFIEEWNDTIVPMMNLMNDAKFDRNQALDLLNEICETAGVGKRHYTKIEQIYVSGECKTNAKDDSLYKINQCINEYFEENSKSFEAKQRFKDAIAKATMKQIKKLKK